MADDPSYALESFGYRIEGLERAKEWMKRKVNDVNETSRHVEAEVNLTYLRYAVRVGIIVYESLPQAPSNLDRLLNKFDWDEITINADDEFYLRLKREKKFMLDRDQP